MKTIHIRSLIFYLAALLSLVIAHADENSARPLSIQFKGDSTLHAFSGIASKSTMEIIPGEDDHTLVRVTVPVLGLDTDHNTRNKKMYGMFESDKFTHITGEADLATILDPTAGSVALNMTIHGVTREIIAQRTTPDEGHVSLACELSLVAFDLTPPSVFGLINVDDKVEVSVSLDRSHLETSASTTHEMKAIN